MHLFISVFNIYFGNVLSFLYFSQHSFCFTVFLLCCQSLAAILYLNYLFVTFRYLFIWCHNFCHTVLFVNILLFRT